MSRHASSSRGSGAKLLIPLVLIVIAVVVAVFALPALQKRSTAVEAPSQTESPSAEKTLVVDGVEYVHNDNVRSTLILLIDDVNVVTQATEENPSLPADTVLVLVEDTLAGTWQMLELNSATLADMKVLDLFGREVGEATQQLGLAHTYGDGMKESCANTLSAVSSLLNGEPISGYISMNTGGLSILNSSVGGINVPDGDASHASLFTAAFTTLQATDNDQVLKAYDAVFPYMVTSLGSQSFLDLVSEMRSMTQLTPPEVEGMRSVADGELVFVADESSLLSAVIQLFYIQK